jgi:phosphoribosyl-AMP cyclohydrolase
VIILPQKALTIPMLGGVLVLAVATTLGAVVALNFVNPTCMPPSIVNTQVNLCAMRFVVAAVLFTVEVTERSNQGPVDEWQQSRRRKMWKRGTESGKWRHVPVLGK